MKKPSHLIKHAHLKVYSKIINQTLPNIPINLRFNFFLAAYINAANNVLPAIEKIIFDKKGLSSSVVLEYNIKTEHLENLLTETIRLARIENLRYIMPLQSSLLSIP